MIELVKNSTKKNCKRRWYFVSRTQEYRYTDYDMFGNPIVDDFVPKKDLPKKVLKNVYVNEDYIEMIRCD